MAEDVMKEYARWSSLNVLENANRYPGPTGFFSYVMEDALKAQESLIPKEIRKAHEKGEIYLHKLPYSLYIPYCTGHSTAKLLKEGLGTPTIVSRPARHFDTYVDHIANYMITMQHYFSGAQALSSVEWYAGPFIRNDSLDLRKVKQGIQRLVYNLNYPTRIGLQTPFTNFTIALDAPREMLNGDHAIYGGKETDPLGEYEEEAKKFIVALSELLYEGDAVGQPFTFPIPTIMATAGMLWDDPEIFEAVFKTAAKRGSFYWLNTRVVDPDSSFSMCCRIVIDKTQTITFSTDEWITDVERKRFGGIWAMPDITGSVNVITVNLPRVALLAGGEDDEFWRIYSSVLEIAREAAEWFRERYVRLLQSYGNVFNMINRYLPGFPSSHFNTIGLIGLPEAASIYLNDPDLWISGCREEWLRAAGIMRRMVDFAADRARAWMRGTRVPWNVEEVPGESAAAKLAIKDVRSFPELREYLGDPDNPIYSTSIAPYYGSMELPDRIAVEEKVQKSFTGGVMMHIFLGEEPDPEALAGLTKRLIRTDLVYWSYTPAITVCKSCGRSTTGLYSRCPACGSESVDVWSRIIGYYRPLKNWNPFRKSEFWTRKHYENLR